MAKKNKRVVYFVRAATGEVKIGLAANAVARMAELQVGCPCELTLLGWIDGTFRTETGFHKQFAHLLIHGEWFTGAPDLLGFIAELCPNGPKLPPPLPDWKTAPLVKVSGQWRRNPHLRFRSAD